MLVWALMEIRPKDTLRKIRQEAAIWRHHVRHAWDELREHVKASRPVFIESDRLTKPGALNPSILSVARARYRERLHEFRIPLIFGLLFLFGVMGGYALKSFALDHFTIGHEDYRLVPAERLYALNALREQALAGGASLTAPTKPNYPSCNEDVDLSVDESEL